MKNFPSNFPKSARCLVGGSAELKQKPRTYSAGKHIVSREETLTIVPLVIKVVQVQVPLAVVRVSVEVERALLARIVAHTFRITTL